MTQPCIVITGITRRVGAWLAGHYLDKGWKVIGTHRRENHTLRELMARGLIAVKADLTEPGAGQATAEEIAQHTADVDVLVHNASLWFDDAACAADASKPLMMYRIHVQNPLELTEALNQHLPVLPQANGHASRMVVFLTDAHISRGDPDHIHYSASKAAVEGAIRSLALKYQPHTRINAIAPGLLMFHPHDSDEYRKQRLAERLLPFEPGPSVVGQTLDYLIDCPLINQAIIKLDSGHHAS
ncbi:MAG TPA: SDR family NAD(P)-dependent oxidoreductase [Halothiobacillaceae bacterium]|nr:SDR family NAD(P)-dependent oxidoreductase [Halothiobacillaceae bacterium]